MKHICPKCGCREFLASAQVSQGWRIDEEGNFLECVDDCEQVVCEPAEEDIWTCNCCLDDARGVELRDNEVKKDLVDEVLGQISENGQAQIDLIDERFKVDAHIIVTKGTEVFRVSLLNLNGEIYFDTDSSEEELGSALISGLEHHQSLFN